MGTTNYKQAVKGASGDGYACYDLRPWEGVGHVTVSQEGDMYNLEGSIDGVRVVAEGGEDGFHRVLEELNIKPKLGWYSL